MLRPSSRGDPPETFTATALFMVSSDPTSVSPRTVASESTISIAQGDWWSGPHGAESRGARTTTSSGSSPAIVTARPTVTDSSYVPGRTRTVSPGAAASTASPIVAKSPESSCATTHAREAVVGLGETSGSDKASAVTVWARAMTNTNSDAVALCMRTKVDRLNLCPATADP